MKKKLVNTQFTSYPLTILASIYLDKYYTASVHSCSYQKKKIILSYTQKNKTNPVS